MASGRLAGDRTPAETRASLDEEPSDTACSLTGTALAAFPTIESAHNYLTLLGEAVAEARRELAAEIRGALRRKESRRAQGYQLAAHHVECLSRYLAASRRSLNSLRSLRRLLLGERANARPATEVAVEDR
jgi:hypothetical protein